MCEGGRFDARGKQNNHNMTQSFTLGSTGGGRVDGDHAINGQRALYCRPNMVTPPVVEYHSPVSTVSSSRLLGM